MTHFALIGLIDLQLFLAVAVLFSVGFFVSRLSGPFWFCKEQQISPAHLVAVGQLVVVLEFYLRSFSNHLTGRVLPITALDVLVLLLVLALAVHWKEGLQRAGRVLWRARLELALFAAVAAMLLFVMAWNELPRVTMLSSDPDQHAFWARQVERFRTLPYFHQFWWGDAGFEYPGGFAILNYAWMSLSGLDARQIVSVQALLQVQIAILVLCETIRGPEQERPWRFLVAIALCFLAYYLLLPYGYERIHYYLGAAGRTASMLLAALPLDLLLFALGHGGDELARRDLPMAPQAQLLGLSALVAGWINIVNLPYLLAISAGGLIALLALRPSRRRGFATLFLFVPLPLILVDPYYMKRLLFHDTGRVVAIHREPLLPFSALPGRWGEAIVLWVREPHRIVGDFLQTDLLSDRGTVVACAILAACVLAVGFRWRSRTAASLGIALALLFAIRALVYPLTVALRQLGPDYDLLSTYMEMSRQQLVILIWYACIALVAVELAWRLSTTGILILVSAIVLFSRVAPNTEIGPCHRQIYSGPLDSATPGDLTVIRHAESLFRSWRNEHPVMDFTNMPRILIPNGVANIGRENWLFPYGGARILPLADVFPVAFFYFEGSREYTFEAYRDHVCNRFDADWLLARNIRYLFLPAQRGWSCIANLDSVVASARMLANDENAQLLEISSQPLR